MQLRLIRHATLLLRYAGRTILVDPLLAPARTYRSLTLGASSARNPTCALPCPQEELLSPDLLLVTHLHLDHFDAAARALLPRSTPLVCPPSAATCLRQAGFDRLCPVDTGPELVSGIAFRRTVGRHGYGLVGRLLVPVSGFALSAPGEPSLHIAGDTVWCPELCDALLAHRPDVVVLNGGAARLNVGGTLTMSAADIAEVCALLPEATVIAVHLDAFNHCRLGRSGLRAEIAQRGLGGRVRIPDDGAIAYETGAGTALRD